MKAWKIFTGFGLILAAALLILNAVGVITPLVSIIGEVTVFEIICGLIIIAMIFERIIHGKFYSIFFLLAFLFMLFEENVAHICHLENENIINNWLLLLIALLLTAGFAILFPSPKRSKKHRMTSGICSSSTENSLSAATIYVDCKNFTPSRIENSLGSCSIYFEDVESYESGKTLYVENNLGAMSVNVPEGWIVKTDIDTNLGGTSIDCDGPECGPILYIKGENNLGALSVEYV